MSNYNLERGQELYFNELNKQAKDLPDLSEDIMKLGALFGFNVGVMQEKAPSKDFSFDDETCVLSYDWTPSYKKLSVAILNVATQNSKLEEKMSPDDRVRGQEIANMIRADIEDNKLGG